MNRMPSGRIRTTISMGVVLAIVAAACGGATTDPPVGTTVPSSPPGTSTTVPLIPLQGPPEDLAGYRAQPVACGGDLPPDLTPQEFTEYTGPDVVPGTTATLTTSCGDIVIELDPGAAPETVRSFVFLAEQGYFDGTAMHRIVPQFVIQGGDPTATGGGGPGYLLSDEFPPDGFIYEVGVVAMANAGPGTTGSQFFIMINDAGLPPRFSVFATVLSGFDTLEAIAAVPLGANRSGETSVPLESVFIESVTIEVPY